MVANFEIETKWSSMKAKDELAREEIILNAQNLFKLYGLKKTTMDEIATACGKAKSTLYHYYKSKDEVFDAVVLKELKNLRLAVKSRVDQQKTLKDKLTIYIIAFHQEILKKINLYRILRHEMTIDSIYQRHFNEIMTFERNYISRILLDAYDTGEFTDFPKDDIPWFSETIIAAFLGIVKYTMEKEEYLDVDKLQNAAKLIIPKIFA